MNGYRLVRAPEGIEAFDNADGTFTLFTHHAGTVSRWVISADDFTLLDGATERWPDSGRVATDEDASGILGGGWRLQIKDGRVVATHRSSASS